MLLTSPPTRNAASRVNQVSRTTPHTGHKPRQGLIQLLTEHPPDPTPYLSNPKQSTIPHDVDGSLEFNFPLTLTLAFSVKSLLRPVSLIGTPFSNHLLIPSIPRRNSVFTFRLPLPFVLRNYLLLRRPDEFVKLGRFNLARLLLDCVCFGMVE